MNGSMCLYSVDYEEGQSKANYWRVAILQFVLKVGRKTFE